MRFLALLLVVLLPVFGSIFLMHWDRETRMVSQIDQTRENLTQILSNLARGSLPEFYFQQKLKQMVRALQWGEDPFSRMPPLDGQSLKVFLFDGSGRRVQQKGFTEGFVYASEQCIAVLKTVARNPGFQVGPKESRLLSSLLGGAQSSEQIALNPGKFVALSEVGIERLAGVFPFRDTRGRRWLLLGIVELRHVRRDELVAETLGSVHRKLGETFSFGVRDLTGKIPDRLFGTREFPAHISKSPLNPGLAPTFRKGESIFGTAMVSRRYQLFASCPVPPPPVLLVSGFSLVMWVLVLIIGSWRLGRTVFIPIRLQVIGLFAIAGLGGLVTLLGFSRTYLEICRETLIRQAFERALDILGKADDQFLSFQHQKVLQLRPIMASIKDLPRDLPKVAGHLERLKALKNLVSVFLVGEKGDILWSHEPDDWHSAKSLFGNNFRPAVRQVSSGALNKHNRELDGLPHQQEVSSDGLEQELFVRQVGEKLFAIHGNITRIRMGKKLLDCFYDIAFNPQKRAIGSLFVTFEKKCLERTFFHWRKKLMKREASASPDLFLSLQSEGSIRPKALGRFSTAFYELREINEIISQTLTPGFRIGKDPRNPVLVTGYPTKNFDDTNFFLLTSLLPMEQEFLQLKRRFYGLAAVFFGFALSLGYICSLFLVQPLNELSQSVKNLTLSRFHSLPSIRTGDLLEDISQGIVEIMNELAELATARQVQEQLFPHEPLAAAGYFCQGWFRSHSDLGGEIFDHHEREQDGRIAFWIAGVRGGKIESALRLAMSKMALRLMLEQPNPAPLSVLQELQRLFFPSKEAVGNMSMFLGMVDRASGRILYCARGPFFLAVQQAAEGSSWETRFFQPSLEEALTENTCVLQEGQRLAVFSSGWFTSFADTSMPHRTAQLAAILTEHARSPSQALGEKVFASADDSSLDFTAAECRTILLLERRSPA